MVLLTTTEVAERLRVSVATVNKYARKGALVAITLPGGQRRYRPEDVERLLQPVPAEDGAA